MLFCVVVEDVHFNFNLLEEVDFLVDGNSGLARPVEFSTIPESVFAEQLTFMDAVRSPYQWQHQESIDFFIPQGAREWGGKYFLKMFAQEFFFMLPNITKRKMSENEGE